MIRKIEIEDGVVEFDDTPELRDAVFEKVLKFFTDHGAFTGEAIFQSDGPQIDGPDLLSDLADDLFKFNVEWRED